MTQQTTSRRDFLKVGGALSSVMFLGGYSAVVFADAAVADAATPAAAVDAVKSSLLNFKAVAASVDDVVHVPEGYTAKVLISFGDKMFANSPEFKDDRTNSGADMAQLFGENNDGMEFYATTNGDGVLAINNEYFNPNTMYSHKEDMPKSADETLKAQNACGLSLIGLKKVGENGMEFDIGSKYNRRVTAHTPMTVSGPAAGHDLLKTAADPEGRIVLGTLNNCSSGKTPWGTYVTCEENFDDFFGADDEAAITNDMKAYGVKPASEYGWEKFDERFNINKTPNEVNRFGYVVEIDPLDPSSTPIKRTALGRFKHENVAMILASDGRVVAYSGDDEVGQYIYKFVSKNAYKEGDRAHNMSLFDEGTLYVAVFDGGAEPLKGTGKWVALTAGQNGLTADKGFATQGDIAVRTRQAADVVGATKMDRPEWIAIHPHNGTVFCTLTNNPERGKKFPLNAANPRENNLYGHIIRWAEAGNDHAAETFTWDIFVLAGNPTVHEADNAHAGTANVNKDNTFNSPDGIGFDSAGRIWIQTDGKYSNKDAYANQGNNSMLVGDPATGEIRRFLTGPKSCEITGIAWANDERTMFINVQHPGEANDSTFPGKGQTPRSSVIMITKNDGGVIGS